MLRLKYLVLSSVMLVLALSACGAPAAPAATSAPAGPQVINVSMTTYGFKLRPDKIKPGEVKFVVKNDSTDLVHEFVLLKTDLALDKLPMRANDGTKVDEDTKDITMVGEVEDVEVGKSGELTAKLEAGRYVYICNVSGHYALKMSGEFTVAP